MIPIAFVSSSIVLMIFSVFLCIKLIGEVGEYSSKVPWYILLSLICFFSSGIYRLFVSHDRSKSWNGS
jgi:hypothetical protein